MLEYFHMLSLRTTPPRYQTRVTNTNHILQSILTLVFISTMIYLDRMMPHKVFRPAIIVAYLIVAILLLSGWAFMAAYGRLVIPGIAYGINTFSSQLAAAVATAMVFGVITW
jgi:hypothetical protein